MVIARRNALLLAAAGVGAAAAGAVAGALALQSRSGAADLLAARYPDLDGRMHRLLDWRGKVLLCNFWATWCAPCREEVPLLVSAKQQWPAERFEVVGIAIDNARQRQGIFAERTKSTILLLVADATALRTGAKAWQPDRRPALYGGAGRDRGHRPPPPRGLQRRRICAGFLQACSAKMPRSAAIKWQTARHLPSQGAG